MSLSVSSDLSVVALAYRTMGKRLATNLVRRALRAGVAPVREKVRAAWLAEKFREGPAKRVVAIERKFVTRRLSKKSFAKQRDIAVEQYWKDKAGIEPTIKVRAPKTTRTIRRKWRRKKHPAPVIVRKAIARAATVKEERDYAHLRFAAAVGIDYSKRGLRTQQRQTSFLESGRKGLKNGASPVAGRGVSARVNQAERQGAEERFHAYMREGVLNGNG